MRGGKLDRLITIQSPSTTKDSFGQAVGDPTVVVQLWASVETDSGGEAFQADVSQRRAQQTLTIETRFVANITNTMQIVYGGQVYDIRTVAEIGRRQGLRITATCEERKIA